MGRIQDKKATITYLIKETLTNYYKIGKSDNINTRFSSIKSSNIHVKLIGISEEKESILHKKFDNFRIMGEWFNLNKFLKEEKELLSFFIENTKENKLFLTNKIESIRPYDMKYKHSSDLGWINKHRLDLIEGKRTSLATTIGGQLTIIK